MSLESNIVSGFTELATAVKQAKTWINNNAADLTAMTTTATTLVGAINELDAAIDALSAGAAGINDTTTSTDSTWSSSKTSTEISDATAAVQAAILGGAGAAYDTLAELKALLDASDSADDSAIAAINTALGNRLRVDINNQGLTTTQQGNGRTNLDVYSKAEVGDVNRDFVAVVQTALA